jgi:hypothetical protein
MTKKVRIENADTTEHKVRVFLEDLIDGQWVRSDIAVYLTAPCTLMEHYIWSERRLVIEEVK